MYPTSGDACQRLSRIILVACAPASFAPLCAVSRVAEDSLLLDVPVVRLCARKGSGMIANLETNNSKKNDNQSDEA